MIQYFAQYQFQIENKPFATPQGNTYQQSVLVDFQDADGSSVGCERYGLLQAEQVYQWIDNNEVIQANHCFLADFSLVEYRKTRKLESDVKIRIAGIQANHALLLSKALLDFSFVDFYGQEFNLAQSHLIAPQLSFKRSTFQAEHLNFESTLFCNEQVNFTGALMHANHVNFKNVVFRDGKKLFEHANFGKGKVTFTNAEFNEGEVSFGASIFNDGLLNFRFSRFGNGKISFHKCQFGKGEINFEGSRFGDGEFNFRSAQLDTGKLNMNRTKFGTGDKIFVHTLFGDGTISFVNTNFGNGNISFKLAEFGNGKKDFHFCSVNGDMIFERCLLGNGGIDFRAAELKNGKLSFTRTEMLSGEMNFDGTVLKDMRLMFKYTVFGKGKVNFSSLKAATSYLLFENIQLNASDMSFLRAQIGTLNMTGCHLDSYIDLRVTACNNLLLASTIVRDIIDLMPGDIPVVVQRFNLKGMRLIGKIYIDWHKNRLKELIYQQEATHADRAEQFLLLKENFNAIGRYENEDQAYVEFKRAEAKAIREEHSQSFIAKIGANLIYYFRWILFDKVGLFATDPVRVFISMLLVFLLFTFSYYVLALGGESDIVSSLGDPDKLSLWERSFYHSSITFLTIGYGDYYPSGIIRWISSFEGFAGLFLMPYFTVAFVRKILR